MWKGLVTAWLGMALAAAVPAAADHGWSSYDGSKEMTLTGVIKESGYEHPHGHVKLEVPGKTWQVVLAPPSRMQSRGLPAASLAAGKTATVVGYPHRTEAAELRAERITVDGKTVELEVTPDAAAAPWLAWIESSAVAVAMRQWLWLYPLVEIAHIIGIVLLAGGAAMFDLRLLGRSRGLPVVGMARHLLPWARLGLGVVAVTGGLMFSAHAVEFAGSSVFRLKLALIAAACLNAAVFHRVPFRSVATWDVATTTPVPARAAALFSLTLWVSVIGCGRLLAYF